MAITKKKTKLALPPSSSSIDDKAMVEMINKGGSTVTKAEPPIQEEEDKLKSFTLRIYESELAKVREAISKMPKRGRQSMQEFMLEAILDRIEKKI